MIPSEDYSDPATERKAFQGRSGLGLGGLLADSQAGLETPPPPPGRRGGGGGALPTEEKSNHPKKQKSGTF